MSDLVLKDSITIDGENGRYSIDLCFGDITKLPKDQGVDVILVSAFPGSYAPARGTMIGSLQSQLGLSVYDLSKSKSEDLRKDFNCWISQPLPDRFPYRRLVCFERSLAGGVDHTKSLYDLVGSLFRAFQTLFSSNDDISVISPILGSGNQRYSIKQMLKNMVTSCAAWMRVGLPLKSMKLVVYVRNASDIESTENVALLKCFAKLKESLQVTQPIPKTLTRKCDALLIFTEADKEPMKKFHDNMKEEIAEVNTCLLEIKNKSDAEGAENVAKWSQMMEEKMLDSKRVIVFLSPNFLVSKECIDNYNLALCLSRKLNNSLLAPVYLSTMPYVPTYLGMTQWIDIRDEKRCHDVDPVKAGAAHLCQTLSTIPSTFNIQIRQSAKFDIFISYCHRNSTRVQEFVTTLTGKLPHLRIFIDREGLKTGYAWQATLYSALSNSSLIVAFVSEDYLKSKMCYEEFAIGTSQLASREYDSHLVMVQLDSFDEAEVDAMFSTCPSISTKDGDEKAKEELIAFVQENAYHADCKKDAYHMDQTLRNARMLFQKRCWNFNNDTKRLEFLGPSIDRAAGISRKVVICCHPEEIPRATILRRVLLSLSAVKLERKDEESGKTCGSSNLSVDIVSEDDAIGHRLIESGDFVLLMLSALFCSQSSTKALLNVVLALGRSGKCPIQGVIVSSLPRYPSVLHLLPTAVNLEDKFWAEFHVRTKDGYPLEIPETKYYNSWRFSIFHSTGFQVALRVLCEWVLHCLCESDEEGGSTKMVSVSALQNIVKDGYFPNACVTKDDGDSKVVEKLSQTTIS